MNNEKVLLVHGFDYDEQLKLNEVLKENNLPLYKVIDEAMVNTTIEEILMSKEAGMVNTPVQEEKVVLFNQCSDEEIRTAMRAIKACYSQKPIFAVVTPTSMNWKFNYLLEHLMEERSRFEKNT